jgi:hypothetical protein
VAELYAGQEALYQHDNGMHMCFGAHKTVKHTDQDSISPGMRPQAAGELLRTGRTPLPPPFSCSKRNYAHRTQRDGQTCLVKPAPHQARVLRLQHDAPQGSHNPPPPSFQLFAKYQCTQDGQRDGQTCLTEPASHQARVLRLQREAPHSRLAQYSVRLQVLVPQRARHTELQARPHARKHAQVPAVLRDTAGVTQDTSRFNESAMI